MKGIILAGFLALGIGTTTTMAAQETKYHARYRGEIAGKETTQRPQVQPIKKDVVQYHNRPAHHAKMKIEKDPKAMAINKTIALDKKVGLTHKQEKKVQRLYYKEAKQVAKLQELRKENRMAMKDILTQEQWQQTKPSRTARMHVKKGYIKPMPSRHAAMKEMTLIKKAHPAKKVVLITP